MVGRVFVVGRKTVVAIPVWNLVADVGIEFERACDVLVNFSTTCMECSIRVPAVTPTAS